MRAVNLIPAEARRGAGGAAGRSSGGAHVLLGALALLLALVAVHTLSGREIATKQAELTASERRLADLEAAAARLQGYEQFAALRERRVQTVASIAGSRFDWSHSLRELSRVTSDEAWLTAVTGTVTPGVGMSGGGGGLRGALPLPALELTGCTVSQDAVARMMSRLRQVDGVERVSLASSEKAAPGAGGGGPGGDCRMGSAKYPQFQMVVFLSAPTPATTPGAATASATPASAKTSTPAAGQSTP
jgi:Tfp pilus assembly protein PilN